MSIEVAREGKLFAIHSGETSYVFAADDRNLLRHLYWGPRLSRIDEFDVPAKWDPSSNDMAMDTTWEEYPCQGQFRYKECCLAVAFADGSREIRAIPVGHEVAGEELIVRLLDPDHGLAVDLHYRCHDAHGLIERWATIRNESTDPALVTRAFSAQFHIPFEGLEFHNTHGQWGAELQPFSQQVGYGKVLVESRRGLSSHNHNPSFILDRGADEGSGEVWFGGLKLSGSFAGIVEQRTYGSTLVQFGISDHDFAHELGPGGELVTPAIVAGYSATGFADMTVRMQAYGRSLMSPEPRLVLYNSWEATGFDVTSDNQMALAERAARVGAELFVLDDGWFGRRSGAGDGLGDWWVNREKFPDGLDPLIEKVRGLGMRFGLWLEPEMVNPASDLFRDHPDWIHSEPGREPDTARDQLVLDVGRRDVQDFIVDVVDGLLSRHDISYVKWDANRPISQVGAPGAHWRHIDGLYRTLDRIRQRHPGVLFEACASGGGRIDLGALEHFDDFWTSDNTDALDRLTSQEAYSRLYPMKAMRAWVTDAPNFLSQRSIPLRFRCHSAMMGSLGIGANLTRFSDKDLAETAELVDEYKQLRPTIQDGDFHRLDNPSPTDYRLYEYVDGKRAVLFAFMPGGHMSRRPTNARLRGLDPDAGYRFYADWRWQEKSGEFLMRHGIPIWLFGDYASSLTVFDRL